MNENSIFLRMIEDKYEHFIDYYTIISSDLLSMEQQSLAAGFLRKHEKEGVFLFGGFEEAERRQVLFLPDYTGVTCEEEILPYFRKNPQDCPLALLDIKTAKADRGKFSHRDYLGALMGEGIKREKIGDILVSEDGAQVVVIRELAEYLEQNYRHVGRSEVNAKIVPIFEAKDTEKQINSVKFTISSSRLDNIISAVYGLSRKTAVEAINAGKVFVGGTMVTKPDAGLKGGEKIVLRGKGKAIYNGVEGTSKKGKVYISVDKYL